MARQRHQTTGQAAEQLARQLKHDARQGHAPGPAPERALPETCKPTPTLTHAAITLPLNPVQRTRIK
eukprot:11225987-Lingulodinium_polyedra.AAC.1